MIFTSSKLLYFAGTRSTVMNYLLDGGSFLWFSNLMGSRGSSSVVRDLLKDKIQFQKSGFRIQEIILWNRFEIEKGLYFLNLIWRHYKASLSLETLWKGNPEPEKPIPKTTHQ